MYNTGNEVPSSALEDMADNAQVFDGLVTKTSGTVTDRLGNVRRPFQQIVTDMGFNPVTGSFQSGAKVTEYNQCLLDTSTGTFYSWNGALPKVVPAGSTPATAGGIGTLLWVDRTNLMLRNELQLNGYSIDQISKFGIKLDKVIYATDYATPTLAYNATPSGGVLFFPAGTYAPLPAITKPITIIGAGVPSFNSGYTGLTGGTIIKGPLTHYSDNVRLINFGVDSGYDVCRSLYAGNAQEGIVCLASPAASEKYGFIGHNLSVICKDSTSAVHAWALERHQYADVNNIKTCYGLHGQAYKVIDSNISNLISISAGGNGVIIKRDENAECRNSNFSNIVINAYGYGGTGARTTKKGLTVESRRGDDGVAAGNITNINISNISIRGVSGDGIYANGALTSSDTVADVHISNAVVYDCAGNGKNEYGNTLRITYSNCSFSACVGFGATDNSLSNYSKHVDCFAGNCAAGFVGFGANFITNDCVTDNNASFGYYAKLGASCYRSNCRGSEATLFSSDSGVYWFELGLINNSGDLVTPTLLNSWVSYGSPFGAPRYWLANDGTIRFQGAVKSGTLGVAIFVLPTGFRPASKRRFVVSATNASTDIFVTISIDSDGKVIVETTESNNFVSLDGISFVPNR